MRNFILLLLLCVVSGAYAQSRMSSSETSYLYDMDHEFLIDERVARDGDRFKVFLRFRLNSGMVKISDYEISYDLRASYIDEKLINSSIALDTSHVIHNGFREFVYAFEFDKGNDDNLLVIQVDNITKNRRYLKDIALSSANSLEFRPFLIFEEEQDIPLFDPYINTGTKVRINNVFGSGSSFSVKGQENNSPIAMPPFDDSDRGKPEAVPLDTVYGVLPNEVFQFHNPGFYEITPAEDENQVSGILVTDAFFPYFEQYTDLIQPLIYISTNQEFTSLRGASNPKASFEDFVLNTISSNTNIAKDFVKYYYRRIRKSAQLFTETADGWKTDRGMVYQIYGNPRTVFRNETTELWVYALENGGRARFIFDIMKGPAGTRTYKLIRGKKFKDGWMNAVTRWRSGRIIE